MKEEKTDSKQAVYSVPTPWAGYGGPGPPCESLVPALDEPAE